MSEYSVEELSEHLGIRIFLYQLNKGQGVRTLNDGRF